MCNVLIRPLRGDDFDAALALWNETHPIDPITPRIFKRKVLLDVCFDPNGYLLAESEHGLCGFIYVVRRLRPLDNDGSPLPKEGWINGFGMLPDAPEETAGLLLEAAEQYARRYDLQKLSATSYSPFYFTQGFDLDREQTYIEAFHKAGYSDGELSYARDMDLLRYTVPDKLKQARKEAEAAGFSFVPLSNERLLPFWDHLNRYQSPGWRIRIRELLYDNDDYDRVRLVMYQGEVIGFCVFHDPDGSPERFGPFGVREEFRGRKLGQILLADCLCEMRRRGLHNVWMQWTENDNAAGSVYDKAGFTITRRHIILYKEIE